MSALLERYLVETFSYKFDVIRRFLEEVVQVVPFESIAYAVASGSYQTAMQCASALKMSNVTIPETVLMYVGLSDAEAHFRCGTPAHILHSMQFKALEQVPSYNKFKTTISSESEEIVYHMYRRSPFPGILPSLPLGEIRTDIKSAGIKPSIINVQVADDLLHLRKVIFGKAEVVHRPGLEMVSMSNIEDLYPIHDEASVLKSPLNILVTGRRELAKLSEKSSELCLNKQMLLTVNAIRHNELDTCTSLLGGFMHQGVVNIFLSSRGQQEDLFLSASASVGIWALFSLDYSHVQPILAKCHGEQLLVKLFDYSSGQKKVYVA